MWTPSTANLTQQFGLPRRLQVHRGEMATFLPDGLLSLVSGAIRFISRAHLMKNPAERRGTKARIENWWQIVT
jgi:hypothetical protein